MIPFLGATPTQANATQTQALDPLRLLLPGSTASVQVAINPDNGVAGIVYQGIFYPASLPDTVKLGELLKVLIQVEADLMLLKILSEKDDSPKTEKSISQKSEILRPDEKKLLKESLKLDLKEGIQQFTAELKESIKLNPQEIKEQIRVFFSSQDKLAYTKTPSNPTQSTVAQPQILMQPKELLKQSSEVSQLKLPIANNESSFQSKQIFEKLLSTLVESVIVLGSKSEILSPEKIAVFSRSVAHSAEAVVMLQDLPEEGVYKLLKNVLKKLINSDLGQLASPKNTQEKEVIDVQDRRIISEQLNLIKPDKIHTSNFDKASLQPSAKEIVSALPPLIKESIQTVITQFLKTTEVIEKIHAETPFLPQGVYFVVPFAQPLGNHSVEFFLPREREQKEKNRKKKRSSRSHMKLTLPILGEIRIEFLTINDEAHIKIIVESEEVRQKLSEHRFLIEKAFHEIGLAIPSLFIECGRVGSIKPVWLKEQLGVEALA